MLFYSQDVFAAIPNGVIIIIIIIIIIITLGTRSDKIPDIYRNVLKMHFADFARSHTNNRAAAKYGNFIN